jgi:lipoprotein-anchoring transpeptidase ErfK/SrfK
MSRTRLEIDLARQRLRHYADTRLVREYWVSTARNGPGERMHSECTPRGRHAIAEKIGADAPMNSVFVGRRPTGEIWSPAYATTQPPGRDWILTRILWLTGLEPGVNQGGEVDSHARYIYLHGTPDDTALGRPGSRGCVRLRNRDIVELFAHVEVGDEVLLFAQ